MTQMTLEQLEALVGSTVVDHQGDKVGKIADIYLDRDTKQAEWALVESGLFGTKQAFVPLAGTELDGDNLRVPYDKALVYDAPQAEPDGELSQDEEARLYQHYGLGYSEAASDSGLPTTEPAPSGGSPDDAMTRSEEELRVGIARRPSELVRLKKYVVTEPVATTVPVQREEVRLEREPITEDNVSEAMAGPDIAEAEHEVTLMEEQVVVAKQAVPKERVRVEKDVVAEEQTVTDAVRKEQIDVERGATDPGP
ncbi:MAG: PRC and DUF2382 domain-containing protein [Actinomycetota bacterium]|nr:PRC and DUF2382 domain-containing protein [Actinomycetota bacterium]